MQTKKTPAAQDGRGCEKSGSIQWSIPVGSSRSGIELGLAGAAHRAEALLEFVDASLGVNKLLLTSEERMRIGCDTHGNNVVVNTVNLFNLVRLGR